MSGEDLGQERRAQDRDLSDKIGNFMIGLVIFPILTICVSMFVTNYTPSVVSVAVSKAMESIDSAVNGHPETLLGAISRPTTVQIINASNVEPEIGMYYDVVVISMDDWDFQNGKVVEAEEDHCRSYKLPVYEPGEREISFYSRGTCSKLERGASVEIFKWFNATYEVTTEFMAIKMNKARSHVILEMQLVSAEPHKDSYKLFVKKAENAIVI